MTENMTITQEQLLLMIETAVKKDREARSWLAMGKRGLKKIAAAREALLIGFVVGALMAVPITATLMNTATAITKTSDVTVTTTELQTAFAELSPADQTKTMEVLDDAVQQNFHTGHEYREYIRYQFLLAKKNGYSPTDYFAMAVNKYLGKISTETDDTEATIATVKTLRLLLKPKAIQQK
jgi:hypothetical protein